MPKILVVEDTNFLSTVLRNGIQRKLGFEAVWVRSYGEADRLLADNGANFYLSFLDLNLPDAEIGEIVDLVKGRGIPAIVFTSDLNPGRREELSDKGNIDYVLKDTPPNSTS